MRASDAPARKQWRENGLPRPSVRPGPVGVAAPAGRVSFQGTPESSKMRTVSFRPPSLKATKKVGQVKFEGRPGRPPEIGRQPRSVARLFTAKPAAKAPEFCRDHRAPTRRGLGSRQRHAESSSVGSMLGSRPELENLRPDCSGHAKPARPLAGPGRTVRCRIARRWGHRLAPCSSALVRIGRPLSMRKATTSTDSPSTVHLRGTAGYRCYPRRNRRPNQGIPSERERGAHCFECPHPAEQWVPTGGFGPSWNGADNEIPAAP